jgi:aminoglycoside phosphotransferase family enzyme
LDDFEDLYTLRSVFKTIANKIALAEFDGLKQSIALFLKKHQPRLQERGAQKFWVDGHGDLHTRNIFLTEPPTIFDCVEFNPHYRRMDILNELAFLCMDLEFYQKPTLANAFMQAYLNLWQVMPQPEDLQLFEYFKAYRANIRLKITLLELEIRPSELLVEVSKKYWSLLSAYCRRLNTT